MSARGKAAVWLALAALAPRAEAAQLIAPAPVEPAVAAEFALGAEPLLDRYLESQAALESKIDAILAIPDDLRTFDNTVKALETATAEHDDLVRPLSMLGSVSPDPIIRMAAEMVEEDHGKAAAALWSRSDLHRAVAAYAAKEEELTGEDAAILATVRTALEESGAHLPPAERKRYEEIQDRLATLIAEFQSNINDSNDALELPLNELKGLPQKHIDRLQRTPEGKYVVSLDYDDYFPFMKQAESSDARRRLFVKFYNRSTENLPLLSEMLRLRQEAARLQGQETHAHFQIDEDRLSQSPAEVWGFLNRVWRGLRGKAESELKELLEAKRRDDPTAQEVPAWDKDYYTEKLKNERFGFSTEEVKQYFPMDRVVNGTLGVYERLFGLSFSEVRDPKVWHPDVKLFEVRDSDSGRRIGHFYLDLFSREGKYKHFAVYDVVKGRELADGSYQEPTAMMVANFSRPGPEEPSLLDHEEVETFFHEFGHLMHETLTRARYAAHAGINVPQDFLEAPSQMLENFAWDRGILDELSGHWRDPARKLPPELLDKMLAARSFGRGLKYARQIAMSMIDMMFHMAVPVNTSIVYNQMMEAVGLMPYPAEIHAEASWDHLLDYDAGYYGYLRAEVASDDMFERFRKEGLLNPATGRSFRREVLESGDSRPVLDSMRAFLGREPSDAAFLEKVLGPAAP